MNKRYIKIETQANIENLSPIRLCLSTFLSNLNIHMDELVDIKTAISEAVSNAIDHAYESDEKGKIIAIGEIIQENIVQITIQDFGKGIEDVSLAMTPTYTTKAEEEHAGMGFTIMESFMDEVIVDSKVDEGTSITLTRRIRERIGNNK